MSICCAAIQWASTRVVSDNLATAGRLLEQAAAAGAELAVLPESFALFDDPTALKQQARREAESGELRDWLADRARRLGLYIVGGTVAVASDDGRAWAECNVFGPDGDLLGCYRKIHLFDARVADSTGDYRESDNYRPGDQPCVVDTPIGRIGLAVCYDLRFPALFECLLDQGMDLLAVPSAFTRSTGLAHWLPLLRARAIEGQCLVVGANQGGEHSARRKTSGGSAIIDAWGRVLAEAGFGETVLTASWDQQAQREIRERMPLREHRRFRVLPR